MKIKIDEEGQRFFDRIEAKKKLESDFIFRLKSEGVEYNRDLDLHRDLLNDLLSKSIDMEKAVQIIRSRIDEPANRNNLGLDI